ncbi:calcium/calmodulin-regulated receptor-like kinase 2 [Quercus lobata]|uniref:calcium/calmodulin-regulated receptor-like kinase 2 n=1 Tax=Quercus lobata TaxID=97700 RepID=UPI001245E620|nr:calcium/calmodulin-regulated receptor-like kinase 2 [Quercus lobata]XP_030953252.1 calcium/calmodulin-regulated receptor-like kinase 2 [Quercus lobata]
MVNQAGLVTIGISVGLALGILIAFLVFRGIRWYRKRAHLRRCANEHSIPSTTLPIRTNGLGTSTEFSASLTNSITIQGSEQLHKSSQLSWWKSQNKDGIASPSGILRYSYKDIQKATQNFTTILGQGSFGPVYKATLNPGEVAVKVLASNSKQGEKEFQTEVSLLGRLHHRNLVNLVGYCVDKGQHMLIYEFMSNGSLANLLYGEGERILSWDERLQIALDIAHGIEYLHEGAVPPVIHRDLKSANILLDRSMRAKVADFGLSKEEVFDGRNSGLKGTYGYIDPVYVSTNNFTMKSDIYSFGIIIFELITSIHPQQNLMEYINLASMSHDGVDEILDKKLAGECNVDEVRGLASIAHKCLHKLPRKRPSIAEVSQAILKLKQRRLAKVDTMSFASCDFSRAVSRIEDQQVELRKMASLKESE